MKGLILKTRLTLCAAGGLAAGGCWCYDNFVDPCYPPRYEYMARQEIQASFDPQVFNGHVLDQTIWNWYFEPGPDQLTGPRDLAADRSGHPV